MLSPRDASGTEGIYFRRIAQDGVACHGEPGRGVTGPGKE